MLQQQLAQKVNQTAQIIPIAGQSGLLYRVRLGPYSDRAAAAALLPQLQQQGFGGAKVISGP